MSLHLCLRLSDETRCLLRSAMTVVHSDAAFLEDMSGKLREYVLEELNVRTLHACDDPLQFATLRADPDLKSAPSLPPRCVDSRAPCRPSVCQSSGSSS